MRKNKQIIETFPPLLCWDIYMSHYYKLLLQAKKRNDIQKLNSYISKVECQIETDFILVKTYDAIVLTDNEQTILWVNKGFVEMTGYTKSFTIGKKPSFLQGVNTSNETKRKITKKIKKGLPFKETIINYKKDKSEYNCEIEVYPLKTSQGKIKAFLALEKEVL